MIRLPACLLGLLLAFGVTAAERPNIVLILADDLGYECLGAYGGTSYRTPNLDRLAADGRRFDHAYATPLCTNTRLQLMTGRYTLRNWIAFGILDPRERTFGHLLQDAGYRTCIAGKWQLWSYDPPDYPGAAGRRGIGTKARDAGFHSWSLWHTGHTEDKGGRYADPVIEQDGRFRTDTRGKYGDDLWVEYINDFMTANRERPFFVYYSMALPHWPMGPTPDSKEWSDPARRHEEDDRYFADMVAYTDKCVGRVVGKIAKLGLSRKTLVLFYGDNGTHRRLQSRLGDRVIQGGKGLTTDAGTHVPLIARWPGTIQPGVNSNLVDSVDFLPTLAEAAGHQPPREQLTRLDGVSFYPQLLGRKGVPRDYVFCHFEPRPGWDKEKFTRSRYAFDQRWKLYDDGRFFDRSRDELEQLPLLIPALSPEANRARDALANVLRKYPMP